MDIVNKENPDSPIEWYDESKVKPAQGENERLGHKRRGKVIQFPLRPPNAGRPQKGPSGGAA